MVHAQDLKFCMYILDEKIVDPYFFFMPELCPTAPVLNYPLEIKIWKSCVQDISKGIKARAIKFGTLVGAKE